MKCKLAIPLSLIFMFFNSYMFSQDCDSAIIFFNQLDLSISSNGAITLSQIDCDLCRIGPNGAEICKCKQETDCDVLYKEFLDACEEDEYYEECKERWKYEVSIGDTYGPLDKECCEGATTFILDCLELECGEVPAPIKGVKGYGIQVEIWQNQEDTNGSADYVYESSPTQGTPKNSIQHNIPEELLLETGKLCIKTTFAMKYDDGSCCVYIDIFCTEL